MIGLVEVIEKPAQPPIEAYSINIGYGGIAVYTQKALTGRVGIKVYFEDGAGTRLSEMVSGRVIWAKPVGSWHSAGIAFESLDSKQHAIILGFLERANG